MDYTGMPAELGAEVEDRDVGFAVLVRELEGWDDDFAGAGEGAAG